MIRNPSPPPSLPTPFSCLVTNIKKGGVPASSFQVSLVFYRRQTPGEFRRQNTTLKMAEELCTKSMLLAWTTEFIPSSALLLSS